MKGFLIKNHRAILYTLLFMCEQFQGSHMGCGDCQTAYFCQVLEYRFSQFESKEVLPGVTYQPSNHTVRAGIAYKFGVGGGTSTARAED